MLKRAVVLYNACWIAVSAAAAAGVMLALFKELLDNDKHVPACDCFNWLKLWLGFYLNNAILPVCMLYTYFNPWIQWGGIWYIKKGGKVRRLSKPYKWIKT